MLPCDRVGAEQHVRHHEIARAEIGVEPFGIAEASGEFAEALVRIAIEDRQARFEPRLLTLDVMAMERSPMGGSTVLRAANIHMTARALASCGRRPAWFCAMWKTIAADSNRTRSPSS
jgi:hypothetical protein